MTPINILNSDIHIRIAVHTSHGITYMIYIHTSTYHTRHATCITLPLTHRHTNYLYISGRLVQSGRYTRTRTHHTHLGGESEVDEFFDAPEARAHAALRGQKSKLVSAIFFFGSVA